MDQSIHMVSIDSGISQERIRKRLDRCVACQERVLEAEATFYSQLY
jgi:hypothetical protein